MPGQVRDLGAESQTQQSCCVPNAGMAQESPGRHNVASSRQAKRQVPLKDMILMNQGCGIDF